jgi:hypothetical protein
MWRSVRVGVLHEVIQSAVVRLAVSPRTAIRRRGDGGVRASYLRRGLGQG